METLKAKLVHDNGEQRFYELSQPIKLGRALGRDVDIEARLAELLPKVSDTYKDSYPRECRIVCISDSHTHYERLAFVGAKHPEHYYRTSIQIQGIHTMMIHGGDESSCKDDKVYLRALAMQNGLRYDAHH